MYVDDLVIDVNLCSSGFGNVLMDYFKVEVECLGCVWFVFDMLLFNVFGYCFYYCNGLFVGVLCFGINM